MVRVVITGAGTICSIANRYDEVGPSMKKCVHGIGPVTLFPANTGHPVAEVKHLEAPDKKRFRTSLLAEKAMEDALSKTGALGNRTGVSFSTCTMGMLEMEQSFIALKNGHGSDLSFAKSLSAGSIANEISCRYGFSGPVASFSTACSSSANALACAFFWIRQGMCDAVVAGGSDSLCRLTYYGFQSLKVMSDTPCTPFDVNRKGMNIGEGAAVLLLESLESAKRRGSPVLAEVMGVGLSADAYHMSAPHPNGEGAYLAMKKALEEGSMSPEQVDYISAHGTGTRQNDVAESIAIGRLFANHCERMYVNSIKSYIGHTLGAAGAMAVVFALNSMEQGFIPPTIGLQEPDPECRVLHPPSSGTEARVETILINAFAFGGNNTTILLRKFHG